MRVLALETSAKACSAAVTEDGRVLASAFQCTGLTHSRTLMPMVEAMLKNAELTLGDCDAIAVANGPGSFTGIRIGVSAAKGLAFSAEKPAGGLRHGRPAPAGVQRGVPRPGRPAHPPDPRPAHRPGGAGGGTERFRRAENNRWRRRGTVL